MSDLECGHCGGIAFTSKDYRDGIYWFSDGDGDECAECGMPGQVVVDSDGDEEDDIDAAVWWSDSQEPGVYCTRDDCEECDERRATEKRGED